MWGIAMSFCCTKWAWQQVLPHMEKIILLALAEHANKHNECHPSMSTLAEECGMCRRSVIRIVEKLIKKKLVFVKKRVTHHGKSTHIYILNTAVILNETPCDSQSHLVVTPSHIEVVTHSHIEPVYILDDLPW